MQASWSSRTLTRPSPCLEACQAAALELRKGRAARALQILEPAHKRAPEDPMVAALLGQALLALRRRGEARDQLRHAGAMLVRSGAPLQRGLEVVEQLQRARDFEGAEALIERLIACHPLAAAAHHALAVCLAQVNRPTAALQAARAAAALAPADVGMQVHQASLEADIGDVAVARERLERVLAGGVGPAHSFRAHREMARALDSLGEPEGVFAHVDAAFASATQLETFRRHDPATVPQRIAENLAALPHERAPTPRARSFATPAPVFVMGFFRSGTTLTQQVLATHPDVFVADEEHLAEVIREELARLDPSDAPEPQKLQRLAHDQIEHLRVCYWQAARSLFGPAADAPVFVDKTTMNTVDVALINTVFPDAKIVFLLRDPRDVCLSCILQLMPPTASTIHLLSWRSCTAFYARVMDWWEAARERLDLDVLEFRYEDMVANFDRVSAELFRFLGLSPPSAASNFYVAARANHIASPSRGQVARPLFASSVGRWRAYAGEIAQSADLLAPFIEDYGYAATDPGGAP